MRCFFNFFYSISIFNIENGYNDKKSNLIEVTFLSYFSKKNIKHLDFLHIG